MADPRAELESGLSGSYEVERELGRGGMATVYLARDLKHARPVALKVLRPELAEGLGPDRFRREITFAARLQHPHILTVLDSGESRGRLWFTMPFVQGESLRDRLRREGRLPVEDALRITREAAQALQYAHDEGVVHRDVKPENILLTRDGSTLVTDFGIARALTGDDPQEHLTQTGIAIGTPAYMAPEQALGERAVDARADQYAVAAVCYEMLAGEAPFTGPTAAALIAARLTTPVPSVRARRPEVSEQVDAALARALALKPADRFGSVHEFAHAVSGGAVTPGGTTVLSPPPGTEPRGAGPGARRPAWRRGLPAAALALLAAAVGAGWLLRRERGETAALDPRLVAVAPFRVSGADPAFAYLREGMVDLLAAKIGVGGGVRAADPRSTMSAWRRAVGTEDAGFDQAAALRVARSLGAGRLLLGSIVGTAKHITLTAALLAAADGRTESESTIEGDPDSLPALVDRLAGALLVQGAEAGADRLSELTSTSLPALRAYLDGQAAYRRSDFEGAKRHFARALDLDSSFALAGLGLASAAAWRGPVATLRRGIETAWRARDRLGPRDRAILDTYHPPAYPDPVSYQEQLAILDRAVQAASDVADVWYQAGDLPYHRGPMIGMADAWPLARARFARAVALDSGFAVALNHLAGVSLLLGDTAASRRYTRLNHAAAPGSETAALSAWQMAVVDGDTAARRRALAEVLAGAGAAEALIGYAQAMGRGVEDADSAAADMLRRAAGPERAQYAAYRARQLAMNRGRPEAAARLFPADEPAPALCQDCSGLTAKPLEGVTLADQRRWIAVLDGLFWDGDSSAARDAAVALEQTGATREATAEARSGAACFAGLWRGVRGEDARSAVAAVQPSGGWSVLRPTALRVALPACAATLSALDAVRRDPASAAPAVARLDSVYLATPRVAWALNDVSVADDMSAAVNLVIARLREARGDFAGARAALRRRAWGYDETPWFLTTYLREEGRLAALAGDRKAAAAAYRHYLALRADPEPALGPQVEAVKRALAAVE